MLTTWPTSKIPGSISLFFRHVKHIFAFSSCGSGTWCFPRNHPAIRVFIPPTGNEPSKRYPAEDSQMKKVLLSLVGVFLAVLAFPAINGSSGSALAAMPDPHYYKLYCASNDFYRHFCRIDTYGGVEIVRQKSEAPCIYGRTWGFGDRGIWVDRGCRADFAVGPRRFHDRDWDERYDRDRYDRDGYYDRDGWRH